MTWRRWEGWLGGRMRRVGKRKKGWVGRSGGEVKRSEEVMEAAAIPRESM